MTLCVKGLQVVAGSDNDGLGGLVGIPVMYNGKDPAVDLAVRVYVVDIVHIKTDAVILAAVGAGPVLGTVGHGLIPVVVLDGAGRQGDGARSVLAPVLLDLRNVLSLNTGPLDRIGQLPITLDGQGRS